MHVNKKFKELCIVFNGRTLQLGFSFNGSFLPLTGKKSSALHCGAASGDGGGDGGGENGWFMIFSKCFWSLLLPFAFGFFTGYWFGVGGGMMVVAVVAVEVVVAAVEISW